MKILGEKVDHAASFAGIGLFIFILWAEQKLGASLVAILATIFMGIPVGAWIAFICKDIGENHGD